MKKKKNCKEEEEDIGKMKWVNYKETRNVSLVG